ncbi:MAG: ABC-2 family transporter protein [Defluviitaleaceae bacterium]|nr:ABC-2 family transporter protein [Defluviitaleaceae bacterium]
MKLYMKYFSMHIQSQMQYKTSFFFAFLGQFMVAFGTFLSIQFMFNRIEGVAGFSYEEVLICVAVLGMAFSASEWIGRGFDRFPSLLGNGGFDRILVRPRNEIFQVLASQMDFSRLGRFIQSVAVLAYALPRSGVDWTWDKVLTLSLMLVCGTLLFCGLYVVYAGISFFTLEGLEILNALTHGGREHGRLPFGVYGEGVLKFLTYVVPLALVQYYPLLYLVGREESITYALTPAVALLFLLPCYALFRFGLRHYKSTGS